MAGTLFISYSRADMDERDWLGRLRRYLAPYRRAETVDVWDDSRIATGADWRAAIAEALGRAAAAVLLVGPGFLASDFVMEYELPTLLDAARKRGLQVFPVVVGYCGYQATALERYLAANAPEHPLESLEPAEQNRILNEVAFKVDRSLRSAAAAPPAAGAAPRRLPNEVLKDIARALVDTRTAFMAQCLRRDELVEMIQERLGIKNDMEYEKFFFTYYPQLTGGERFVFDQIRGLTVGQLHDGNKALLRLLTEFPDLMEEIPELTALRQHLVFWLNKFDRVFLHNRAMCLLYTGVEDGVPFPSQVDDAVARRLRASRTP